VVLRLDARHGALFGDAVLRRLKLLGNAMALEPKVVMA
jgi:hypothetical protein